MILFCLILINNLKDYKETGHLNMVQTYNLVAEHNSPMYVDTAMQDYIQSMLNTNATTS